MSHGGKRAGAGRKVIGRTKRMPVTLPEEIWEVIENQKEETGESIASILRRIVVENIDMVEKGKCCHIKR